MKTFTCTCTFTVFSSESRFLQAQVNRVGMQQGLAPGQGAGGDIDDRPVEAFSRFLRVLPIRDHGAGVEIDVVPGHLVGLGIGRAPEEGGYHRWRAFHEFAAGQAPSSICLWNSLFISILDLCSYSTRQIHWQKLRSPIFSFLPFSGFLKSVRFFLESNGQSPSPPLQRIYSRYYG